MLEVQDTKTKLQLVKLTHWRNAFWWSTGFYIFWCLYFYFYREELVFSNFVFALCSTAMVMIAVSFMFGTFTFYTDFLDSKLSYRKYFGLIGYWYAVGYVLLLMLIDPQNFFFRPLTGDISRDQLLGLTAMLILTFMMSISYDAAMVKIGPKLWRSCLRLGYLVYPLFISRAYILDNQAWFAWLADPYGSLPPPSLVASCIGVLVILFRLSVLPVKFTRKLFGTYKSKAIITHIDHPQATREVES